MGLFHMALRNEGLFSQSDLSPYSRVTAVTYVKQDSPVAFLTAPMNASDHLGLTNSRNPFHARLPLTILSLWISSIFTAGSKPACQLLQLTAHTRSAPDRRG